nr:gliding motility-associated C-terminal domain-containing protein [Chitinophagaceae bacterium]
IGLNNSHLANPIATPINSTIYTVTASNGQCDISDTISVYVNDAFEHDIFIPNSFSPNYDDLNDCFKIVTKSKFEKYSCKIFNRWGQEVFQSNDWNQCWEGNYLNSNKEAPLGTYFYLIEIETDCGRTIKKGDITLLR